MSSTFLPKNREKESEFKYLDLVEETKGRVVTKRSRSSISSFLLAAVSVSEVVFALEWRVRFIQLGGLGDWLTSATIWRFLIGSIFHV